MGSKSKKEQGGFSRREVLGKGAVLLGVAAVLTLPFKLFGGFSGNKNAGSDLPGKDSIFQPRKDANLKKYLQDKGF